MATVGFTTSQQRLRALADTIMLQSKLERQSRIKEMNGIIHTLSADQLIDVIKSINSLPALKFLIPAGAFGEARDFLITKMAMLEKQLR